ncbi:uncharacterized protein LOC131025469 [Salvia miltiorrhiza]|uniref:uncharacterized protein LOC131025469 n=1 Tax=Salvia miltiorrhiza TaxID=226208 RepID=UPI0025ACE6A9|nr:uncharacterized protein LOC131025469 [Salvia miltiorrhiza]
MNSLFSFITTLYALALLYFPFIFSRFLLSPVALSTLILLLYLLRLGAAQRSTANRTDSDSVESDSTHQIEELCDESKEPDPKQDPRHFYADSFVEWDVRAPLEVIYEEYEGEDAAAENDNNSEEKQMNPIRRYASLSLFYPESDSDTSSEEDFPTDGGWGSPERACFRWEEEDDREGLIEIALDEKRGCEVEEDNLIEIDLSPER